MDVLAIREFVWELNEVFTDPSIMKVLHGADMDIQWLQKDFGVYVVAIRLSCDAGQHVRHGPGGSRAGLRVLRSGLSLEALLRRFGQQGVPIGRLEVGVSLGVDRRIRPLTRDMQKYAREDTHFLLYIADELRTLLAAQSSASNLVASPLFVLSADPRRPGSQRAADAAELSEAADHAGFGDVGDRKVGLRGFIDR